eukprot:1196315-Prorocentrum_minimum.AAC.5
MCIVDDGYNYIGTKINVTSDGKLCSSGTHFSMRVGMLYNVQWRARLDGHSEHAPGKRTCALLLASTCRIFARNKVTNRMQCGSNGGPNPDDGLVPNKGSTSEVVDGHGV